MVFKNYYINKNLQMVEAASAATASKTDAEMSMAIDNLSAILNTQDVDQVIELL